MSNYKQRIMRENNNKCNFTLNHERYGALIVLFMIFALFTVNINAQNRKRLMEQNARKMISQMTVNEKILQLLNDAPAIERLGMPSYNWWNEALHGVARNGRATVFPQPIALASSFDTDLVYRVANAISDEGRAKYNVAQKIGNRGIYAGLTYWSPNINIFRDPRWGRGMETYGEDPYLTGKLGVAFVKGLQGEDPFYLKAAACAKHYAVHSGPEALRHEFDAKPTKRDLYETYLPAFEMLVKEANVEAIMGAYNAVYGESASGSKFLLTDVLRDKWDFDGHVVSDCGAIADIYQHHNLAKSAAEASAIAIKSGLNLNCGNTFRSLNEALKQNLISEDDIDKALFPLMMTRMKLGILPSSGPTPYDSIPESVIASNENALLARVAAQKSMVLLENKNNTLPIDKNTRTMFVTGAYAADASIMLGNYFGMSDRLSTFLEGIVAKVSSGTSINYKYGFQSTVPNVNDVDWTIGEAKGAEVCVVVLGLSSALEGEEGDAISSSTRGDKADLSIPKHQIKFLRDVCQNNINKVIAVVTGGSPIDMKEISELADAVVLAWYPGQEGGWALGDLIFGDVTPSGKLPVTFPKEVDLLPEFTDYTMQGRTYKYMKDNIFYPFGYGLTYGKVIYSGITLVKPNKRSGYFYRLKVTVENRGKYDIEDVTQLYLVTPGAGVSTPIQSLIGFQRVSVLAGENKEVEFEIKPDQLKMIMVDGSKKLLKGDYRMVVSGSAPCKRSYELGVSMVEVGFKL